MKTRKRADNDWAYAAATEYPSVGSVTRAQGGNGIVSGRRTREQRIRNSFHHIVIKRFSFIVSTTSFDATVAQRRNNSRRQFRSLLERSEHILNIWTLAVNSNYLCCLEFNGWHFKNCFLNVYKVSHMKSKYNSISLGVQQCEHERVLSQTVISRRERLSEQAYKKSEHFLCLGTHANTKSQQWI